MVRAWSNELLVAFSTGIIFLCWQGRHTDTQAFIIPQTCSCILRFWSYVTGSTSRKVGSERSV